VFQQSVRLPVVAVNAFSAVDVIDKDTPEQIDRD